MLSASDDRKRRLVSANAKHVHTPQSKAHTEAEFKRVEEFLSRIDRAYRDGYKSHLLGVLKFKASFDHLLFKNNRKRSGFCENCHRGLEEHFQFQGFEGPMCPETGKCLLSQFKQQAAKHSNWAQKPPNLKLPTAVQPAAKAAVKTTPAKRGSKFLETLAAYNDEDTSVSVLLATLSFQISCTFELQLFFTIAFAACKQKDFGVNEAQRNKFLREALLAAHTNEIVKTEDDLAYCQLARKKAKEVGAFKEAPELSEKLSFRYHTAALQKTAFMLEIKALIQANTDAIARIEKRLDAHESAIKMIHHDMEKFKQAYRRQQRIECVGSFVKLIVGAVTFGVGNAMVDVMTKLTSIVDLSDSKAVAELLQTTTKALKGTRVKLFDAVEYLNGDRPADAVGLGIEHLANKDIDVATKKVVCLQMLAVASASVDTTCSTAQDQTAEESPQQGKPA